MRFEEAAGLRDLLATVEEIEERQKMAAAKGDDVDIFAVLRRAAAGRGQPVPPAQRPDRGPPRVLLGGPAGVRPAAVLLVAAEADLPGPAVHPARRSTCRWSSRIARRWRSCSREKRGRKVEIHTPQRGQKKALLGLVETNAKHSFDARFRVLKPSSRAIQEALQDALNLPDAPPRIECFDISHIQGTDKVASMVVWEDGRMKKADYRKFIIRTVVGNDDFASMREVVTRRYSRLQEEKQPMPGLVLIDGGLGQLHAAAEALEAIGIIDQPLASIAKREEMIYVLRAGGRADRARPLLADPAPDPDDPRRGAPFRRDVPPLAPQRAAADVGAGRRFPAWASKTVQKLLKQFGSSEMVRAAAGGRAGGGGGTRGGAQGAGALCILAACAQPDPHPAVCLSSAAMVWPGEPS